jgi:hypothetical protein
MALDSLSIPNLRPLGAFLRKPSTLKSHDGPTPSSARSAAFPKQCMPRGDCVVVQYDYTPREHAGTLSLDGTKEGSAVALCVDDDVRALDRQ